jgi:hypothetical protein
MPEQDKNNEEQQPLTALDKAKMRQRAEPPEDEAGPRAVSELGDRHDSQGKLQAGYDAQMRERGTKRGDRAAKLPHPWEEKT